MTQYLRLVIMYSMLAAEGNFEGLKHLENATVSEQIMSF
jgi:hypothetical protein